MAFQPGVCLQQLKIYRRYFSTWNIKKYYILNLEQQDEDTDLQHLQRYCERSEVSVSERAEQAIPH